MSGSDKRRDSPPFEQIDVPRLLQLLFIEARKKGRAWTALCPSGRHVDKHPSWSIREEPGSKRNGKHHCFSCQWGGDAITLTQHALEMTYWGASDFVLERAMREVHPAVAVRIELGQATVRRACTIPAGVYFEPLKDWPSAPQSYTRARGISDYQVDRWGIGYAVDGTLGGRFVIPTRDRRGTLLNWAARTWRNQEKRYLAASSADNHHIDAVFGEQLWEIDASSTLVVCEGAINALAVERAIDALGLGNVWVGALSGSHLEPGHAMKLSQFASVLILTDPDHAGDQAAGKLDAMLNRHCYTSRLRLAEKEDPANVPLDYLCSRLSASLLSMMDGSRSALAP